MIRQVKMEQKCKIVEKNVAKKLDILVISIPTIVGCIGAAMIIVAAVATPIAKSQRMREIWFYVMSSGVMLKVVVMELARIIQFI